MVANVKKPWKFNANLAGEFEKHIKQSIPGYDVIHSIIGSYSCSFLGFNGMVVDIGCSSGIVPTYLFSKNDGKNIKYLGLDIEPEMVEYCQERHQNNPMAKFCLADIVGYELPACDLALAVFTLQFLSPKDRATVIASIFESLNSGGGFLLFEKCIDDDSTLQEINQSSLLDFKIAEGISTDEVLEKLFSIRGVMRPRQVSSVLDELIAANFLNVTLVFKCMGFHGFIAIKP